MAITEEQRQEVEKLLREGCTGVYIRKVTGVSEMTISHIKNQIMPLNEDSKKQFPKDLLPQWLALNEIGRRYREQKYGSTE